MERWWNNKEEIDVAAVGIDETEILLGECKWWQEKVGINVLQQLQRKSEILVKERGYKKVSFALFSKNGFTPQLQQEAESSDTLFLYDFSG